MKKSGITLTDAMVIGLKARAQKYCVWDNSCPGFGVEVTPTKAKLMVAKTCMTSSDGKQLRGWHTLGQYGVAGEEWTDPTTGQTRGRKWNVEDYRLKAAVLKDQVRKGEDPKAAIEAKKAAAQVRRDRTTVNQLCDKFIKEHIRAAVTEVDGRQVVTKIGDEESGNRLSTAKEHIRLIHCFIRPALGHLPVEDVGTSEIDAMLLEIREETPVQSNRVRSVASKLFAKAEIWEYRKPGSNPVKGQERAPETPRERNLTDAEIHALGAALRAAENPGNEGDVVSPFPLAAIRLALFTGMRKGEIQALKQAWVDLEAKEIRIPAKHHKTGKKKKKERVVLLCDGACSVLKSLPSVLGNPYVIAGRGQAAWVNLQSPWEAIRAAAGLDYRKAWMEANRKQWKKATETEKLEIEGEIFAKQVHYHDLRRTFSSVATRLGYSELWIGALLGHAAGTVTAGYARADMNDHPLRKAVEVIGERIAGLLDGSIDLEQEAKLGKKNVKAHA